MTYFIAYYGIWLSLSLMIGILTAFACQQRSESDDGALLRRGDFVLAICVLMFIAVVQVSLGRLALYFESAVFVFAAFLAGVAVIVAFVGRISRDRIGWRIGVASVALVWLFANLDAARDLERDLRHALGSLVERAGGDASNFEVSGRDVYLPADMSDGGKVAVRIRGAAGVRSVWRIEALSASAAERRDKAIADVAARQAANRSAEAAWMRRQAGYGVVDASRQSDPRSASHHGAREKLDEGRSSNSLAAEAPAIVWHTPIDPTLPIRPPEHTDLQKQATVKVAPIGASAAPSSCRAKAADAVASEKIRFEVASASIRNGAEPILDRLAALLRDCPEAMVEIGGHADSQGSAEENRTLSLRRAQTVADHLARIGIERRRLISVGYGVERPLTRGDTPESRAENRRVEFVVR